MHTVCGGKSVTMGSLDIRRRNVKMHFERERTMGLSSCGSEHGVEPSDVVKTLQISCAV